LKNELALNIFIYCNATCRLVVYLLAQLPENTTALSAIHLSTPKNIIAGRFSVPKTLILKS